MNANDRTDLYIKLKSIVRTSGYADIDRYKGWSKGTASIRYKNIGGIERFFVDELGFEAREALKRVAEDKDVLFKINEIDRLFRNQFTSNTDRKSGFGTFESFYTWYSGQERGCFYCGISQDKVTELFEVGKLKSKKFNATLHIERFFPELPYGPENCCLACSLCNNAKSDLISASNFKEYVAPGIEKFYQDLYAEKIENSL